MRFDGEFEEIKEFKYLIPKIIMSDKGDVSEWTRMMEGLVCLWRGRHLSVVC